MAGRVSRDSRPFGTAGWREGEYMRCADNAEYFGIRRARVLCGYAGRRSMEKSLVCSRWNDDADVVTL
jgi:hypothetical protein